MVLEELENLSLFPPGYNPEVAVEVVVEVFLGVASRVVGSVCV